MALPRLRIIDLLAVTAALAVVLAVGRDESARRDPTTFLAPLALSAVAAWAAALAIGARFGDPRRRPFRWGASAFALIYLALTISPQSPGDLDRRLATGKLAGLASAPLTELLMGYPRSGGGLAPWMLS